MHITALLSRGSTQELLTCPRSERTTCQRLMGKSLVVESQRLEPLGGGEGRVDRYIMIIANKGERGRSWGVDEGLGECLLCSS
jgi:hypothetical protein